MTISFILKIASIFVVLSGSTPANHSKTKFDSVPVKVTNWGKRSLMYAEGFFDKYKNEIVKQIGNEKYEEVIKFSNVWAWPEEMKLHPVSQKDSTRKANYLTGLNRLKLYKIGSFDVIGEDLKITPMDILEVPYELNKNWNEKAKWDKCYFLIESIAVIKL